MENLLQNFASGLWIVLGVYCKCLNPDSFFAVPKDDDFCSYGERKDGGAK